MSQNSGDLRVRRTRKLLRDALIALIEERGFDAITVGEIAERAMVSRAAFYRYYQDKYDMVEQVYEEAMQVMMGNIGPPPRDLISGFDPEHTPTPERWVKIFEYFAEYERFYRALLGKKGSTWFVAKTRAYLAEIMSQRAQMLAPSPNTQPIVDRRDLITTVLAGILIDTLTWWLEQGRPYTPRQIATYCYHMVFSILKDMTTWE